MICKNCGAEIDDNAKFCDKCGADVIVEKSKDERPATNPFAKFVRDFRDLWKSKRFRTGFIITVSVIAAAVIAVLLFVVLKDTVISKKYETEMLSASGMKSIDMYYGDYDADGNTEAYAVLYNNKVGYEFKNAQIWFASKDGTQMIDRNFTGHSNNLIKTGPCMFLSLEKNLLDNLQENEYISYIYGVKEKISYQPLVSKSYKNMHQDGENVVALDIKTGEKLYFIYNRATGEFDLDAPGNGTEGTTDDQSTTNSMGTAVYDVSSVTSSVPNSSTPSSAGQTSSSDTTTVKPPENGYVIVFNGNGATGGSMTSLALTVNESKKLPSCTFNRTGYAFNNWNSKPDGLGVEFYNTQEVKNLTNINGATITLYAQWQPISYTIVLDGNGGTSSTMYMVYDKPAKLPIPQRAGYTFYLWKNGSKPYDGGQQVNNLVTQNGGSITLTAVWTPNNYTIAFDGNGAQESTSPVSAQYDANVILPNNGFIKKGYTFEGWNTKADGTGTSYAEGQSVKNLATNGTVKLYAQWKEIPTSPGGDY